MVEASFMDDLKQEIDRGIKELLWGKEPATLYEPMYYLFESGGKRIRPILVILSCQAVGGHLHNCLPAALSVELLHTFTLIHDDMMDHDDLRRGRPTVHKCWDEGIAILAGDGLVTLAYQTLLKNSHPKLTEVVQIFTNGLFEICEGQALDMAFESRDTITVDEYHRMITKKTARLLQVSCEIGVILGNGSEDERELLGRFALQLGRGFQIQDDLLDILSNQRILGKPQGSDLTKKKKTYPVIHFLQHASAEAIETFRSYWGIQQMKPDHLDHIIQLFHQAGTLDEVQKEVDVHFQSAKQALEGFPSAPGGRDLNLLLDSLWSRVS
jgi:geranylgeranyl pyrophosphate synthase